MSEPILTTTPPTVSDPIPAPEPTPTPDPTPAPVEMPDSDSSQAVTVEDLEQALSEQRDQITQEHDDEEAREALEEQERKRQARQVTAGVFFSLLRGTDMGLQIGRHAKIFGEGPVPTVPVPTLNHIRPKKNFNPVAAGVGAGFELANNYTGASLDLASAFSQYQKPDFTSTGQLGLVGSIGETLSGPLHDRMNISGALSTEYIYDRNGPFERGVSYAYGGSFALQAISLPAQLQRVRASTHPYQGCDPAKIALHQQIFGGSLEAAAQDCEVIDADFAGRNVEPPTDDIPNLSLLSSQTWALQRTQSMLIGANMIDASAGMFQAFENDDGSINPAVSLSAGLGLSAAQIGLSLHANRPEEGSVPRPGAQVESLTWGLLSTGAGFGQAYTTQSPKVMRAYSKQNTLISHGWFMPGAYAIVYDSDAQQATGTDHLVSTLLVGGVATTAHLSGGLTLGAAWENASPEERIGLGITAGTGFALNTGRTIQLTAQGHEKTLIPWSIGALSYGVGFGFGYLFRNRKPFTGTHRVLINNLDFAPTGDGGAKITLGGRF